MIYEHLAPEQWGSKLKNPQTLKNVKKGTPNPPNYSSLGTWDINSLTLWRCKCGAEVKNVTPWWIKANGSYHNSEGCCLIKVMWKKHGNKPQVFTVSNRNKTGKLLNYRTISLSKYKQYFLQLYGYVSLLFFPWRKVRTGKCIILITIQEILS